MVSAVQAEKRMKAAVIDRLLEGQRVDDDSVLISEMTVANWTRRADIVLANGRLWAFEIKSEADRLVRLPGQVNTFAAHFEKLTIVVAPRFEAQVREMLPDGVGLWVEESDGCLKERVRSRALPLKLDAALSLMTAADLRGFLSCNGVRCIKAAPRAILEEMAHEFPVVDLANAAREAVKRRFRRSHRAFVERRASVGTLAAIDALRRFDQKKAKQNDAVLPLFPLPELELASDHPLLFQAPAGRVLKRRLRRA
jgi:hypothetical protein